MFVVELKKALTQGSFLLLMESLKNGKCVLESPWIFCSKRGTNPDSLLFNPNEKNMEFEFPSAVDKVIFTGHLILIFILDFYAKKLYPSNLDPRVLRREPWERGWHPSGSSSDGWCLVQPLCPRSSLCTAILFPHRLPQFKEDHCWVHLSWSLPLQLPSNQLIIFCAIL